MKTKTIHLARGEKIINQVFKNHHLVFECEGDNLIQGCTVTGYLWGRKGSALVRITGASPEHPVAVVDCTFDTAAHTIPQKIHRFLTNAWRSTPWVRRAERRATDKKLMEWGVKFNNSEKPA